MVNLKEERKLRQKYNNYYTEYFNKAEKYLGYEEICDKIYNYYDSLDDKELYYMKKKLKSKTNIVSNFDSSNTIGMIANVFFTFFITFIIFLCGLQAQGYYNNSNQILNNQHKILENSTECNIIDIDLNREQDPFLKEKLKLKKQGLTDENKTLQKENEDLLHSNKTSFDSIQQVISSISKSPLYWIFGYAIVIILINYFSRVLSDNRYRTKKSFFTLCLDILEEIEEGRNKEKSKQEKEASREKTIDQIKQHIDGNNVMKNIIIPTMLEIAATTMVRKSVIGKLLGRFKK